MLIGAVPFYTGRVEINCTPGSNKMNLSQNANYKTSASQWSTMG